MYNLFTNYFRMDGFVHEHVLFYVNVYIAKQKQHLR